jgi:serine/threonine protein kinase/tetratricopeptide (TPR) repeat protein
MPKPHSNDSGRFRAAKLLEFSESPAVMTTERWAEVERLYQSAQDLASDRRDQFLAGACHGDDELRHAVESLLAQRTSIHGALDRPAREYAADLLNDPDRTQLAPGELVGAYCIEALLGQGGMGVVYRALDTRLKRPVAIKFLSQEFAGRAARRRFQREAQMASSLNHPHILTVYDVGDSADRHYLVTEFVDGGTLKDWALREKPGWRQVLDLLTGVADGLSAAHTAGILHRDIKPANIFVARNGYAKLGDFGLARLDESITRDGDAKNAQTTALTQPGIVIGTPAYMSPEQAAGKPLDARSDIFSFGIVLYELLAEKRPFDGATGLETLEKIVHQAPDPLPENLPAALRMVVEKALEKDPADRYQSMREMVIDLRRLTRQSGTAGQSVPAAALLSRRWLFAAGAFVFLSAAGVLWWQTHHVNVAPPQIRSIAVLPFENLSRDPDQEFFSDGTTEALISTLGQIHAFQKVISRTSAMRFKGTTKSLPNIGRELGVDAIVEGSVQREGGRIRIAAKLIHASTDTQLWAGDFDRELAGLLSLETEVARAIAEEIKIKVTPAERSLLSRARNVNPAAAEQYLLGNYHGSRLEDRYLKQAIGNYERAIELQPDYAAAWAGLALAWLHRANFTFDKGASEQPARTAAMKAVQLDPNLSRSHHAVAYVRFLYDWDWSGAEKEYRRALDLDSNDAEECSDYGHLLAAMGRFPEATANNRRAVTLDPLSPSAQINLGRDLSFARKYDEAFRQFQRAFDLEPGLSLPYYWLAQVYAWTGHSSEAVAAAEHATASEGFKYPHPSLARVYAAAGRRAEALKIVDRLLAEWDNYSDSRNPSEWVAQTYFALGDTDRGFKWLTNAFDRRELVQWVNVDPRYDAVRSDPRFKTLVARLKLPN